MLNNFNPNIDYSYNFFYIKGSKTNSLTNMKLLYATFFDKYISRWIKKYINIKGQIFSYTCRLIQFAFLKTL